MNTTLQQIARPRIVVDHRGDVMDQADHLFRHVIRRGRLAGEDHAARRIVARRTVEQRVVAGDDVQHVEQLPLVLVNPFDLDVEQAVRVEVDGQFTCHIVRQAQLVAALRGREGGAETGVVGARPQLLQAIEIESPVFAAESLVEQRRQRRVGLRQPAPRRDAVGLVVETLRVEAGKVGEDGLHHEIRVQLRDAVDAVAADDAQVRHAHPLVLVVAAAIVDQDTLRMRSMSPG
jgi:hypothetical protein